MTSMKEPCVICERYTKGQECDEADVCPVGVMKAENRKLKEKNKKLREKNKELKQKVQDDSWGSRSSIDWDSMGRYGVFG